MILPLTMMNPESFRQIDRVIDTLRQLMIVPGCLQGSVLHCLSWCWSPWQSVPPWAGAGLSQSLLLVSVPPPQLLEHWDQSAQKPQEPSPGPKRILIDTVESTKLSNFKQFKAEMVNHLRLEFPIKFSSGFIFTYHVGWVVGGMVVTTMTYYHV